MDIAQLSPYANAICPNCQAMTRVKTNMGPFRITGRLGKGGMSVVYRAEDTVLRREVALKILNDTYSGDELRRERFEREAQIMARVSHENLVQVYAVGHAHGLFYIAMELVEGCGLDALIVAEDRVAEDKALRLTLDIVRGLNVAWEAGLMHRDIKPANVLLSPDGTAKIVDFGLSLLQNESDVEQEIWVTPYYAAPETLLRQEEDFRTDMYALGASMYHLLVGSPPQVDASQSSDVLLTTKKNLPRLEQVVNDISPMTCFIVNKLMSFNKEDRFESYAELMTAVEQALEEYTRGMRESGLSWAERRILEERRMRRIKGRNIAFVSLAVVGVLGLSIWGWGAWKKSKEAADRANVPSLLPTAGSGETPEDALAKESLMERNIRFGKLFNEAQDSLNRGDVVRAGGLFGDLAVQQGCPLSTSLWAGVNRVLCMWVQGQFPDGIKYLKDLEKQVDSCQNPEELKRAGDIGNLIMYLSSANWDFRMAGLRSDLDLALHYYVGMALKSWNMPGKWLEYGVFLKQITDLTSNDDADKSVRERAVAWLSNLKAYTDQYERLKRIQDMPENSSEEVKEKQGASEFLMEQMDIGEVPSMSPARAALEQIRDHLIMQYQLVKDREERELKEAAERAKEEDFQRAEEAAENRKKLHAAQSRSYEEVCREADATMRKKGDFADSIPVYQAAEAVVSSPVVKMQLKTRREMTELMLPLFSRMEKFLPGLVNKKTGRKLVLKDGSKVRLTGLQGHLLVAEKEEGESCSLCWNDLAFNSLYALAKECRQKNSAGFSPMADTFTKPLLIFGTLTNTISSEQQANVLLQLDRSFMAKWNKWMELLEAEEVRSNANDPFAD